MVRLLPALLFGLLAVLPPAALARPDGALVNGRNEMLVTSSGSPARLRDNPKARDHSLADVLRFVRANGANRRYYRPGSFMCTEYALAVHDAAEANGIRCALVSLAFEEGIGHALNAFQTTDFGLVFIDCTGAPRGDSEDAYDTIGYIQRGEPYGRLHVDLGVRSPTQYRFYAESRAILRNLTAWDEELSDESQQIAEAQRSFEASASRGADAQEALQATYQELARRVEQYNADIEYRNELARTFRIQYSENKSPVAEIDLFW